MASYFRIMLGWKRRGRRGYDAGGGPVYVELALYTVAGILMQNAHLKAERAPHGI